MPCQAWRAQLGRFGLSGSHQTSPIQHLSDGLRNRYVQMTQRF
jgi:ATP-binding cassette, subfamily F, member 2